MRRLAVEYQQYDMQSGRVDTGFYLKGTTINGISFLYLMDQTVECRPSFYWYDTNKKVYDFKSWYVFILCEWFPQNEVFL